MYIAKVKIGNRYEVNLKALKILAKKPLKNVTDCVDTSITLAILEYLKRKFKMIWTLGEPYFKY